MKTENIASVPAQPLFTTIVSVYTPTHKSPQEKDNSSSVKAIDDSKAVQDKTKVDYVVLDFPVMEVLEKMKGDHLKADERGDPGHTSSGKKSNEKHDRNRVVVVLFFFLLLSLNFLLNFLNPFPHCCITTARQRMEQMTNIQVRKNLVW